MSAGGGRARGPGASGPKGVEADSALGLADWRLACTPVTRAVRPVTRAVRLDDMDLEPGALILPNSLDFLSKTRSDCQTGLVALNQTATPEHRPEVSHHDRQRTGPAGPGPA